MERNHLKEAKENLKEDVKTPKKREEKKRILDPAACVHCRRCRKNCLFLDKYEIDIGNEEKLRELAYHCFLCGKCYEVCPIGIDGREIILNMRRDEVEKNRGRLAQSGYGFLLFEKQDYIYKNYRRAGKKKSVLFPGCNYPSFYPKTTQLIADIMKKEADMGIVFDCCGKPLAELGLQKREDKTLGALEKRMKENGVEEIVTLCPNCYHYLKPRIGIEVKIIYEKLRELGIGKKIKGDLPVFLPCPDRMPGTILKELGHFVEGKMEAVKEAQCCGLGGCACIKEPELAGAMAQAMEKRKEEIYTYCASCAGNLERKGCRALKHFLNEIIGSKEKAALSSSMLNRAKTKFM